MTVAFENFMKQYKATGSEKADGYSRDVFVGLDVNEKVTVFNLLVAELPFSAEWLFFLDPQKALIVAKEEEQKLRGNGYESAYMLQEQMVKYTGDLLYQHHMIEDYPSYIDDLKPLVIDSIGRTPANTAMVAFLKQVILTEVNPSAVARAARKLLAALNIPRTNEIEEAKYSRLVSELRSESAQLKLSVMGQIAKYETALPVA